LLFLYSGGHSVFPVFGDDDAVTLGAVIEVRI
jgi:hypothetical protein